MDDNPGNEGESSRANMFIAHFDEASRQVQTSSQSDVFCDISTFTAQELRYSREGNSRLLVECKLCGNVMLFSYYSEHYNKKHGSGDELPDEAEQATVSRSPDRESFVNIETTNFDDFLNKFYRIEDVFGPQAVAPERNANANLRNEGSEINERKDASSDDAVMECEPSTSRMPPSEHREAAEPGTSSRTETPISDSSMDEDNYESNSSDTEENVVSTEGDPISTRNDEAEIGDDHPDRSVIREVEVEIELSAELLRSRKRSLPGTSTADDIDDYPQNSEQSIPSSQATEPTHPSPAKRVPTISSIVPQSVPVIRPIARYAIRNQFGFSPHLSNLGQGASQNQLVRAVQTRELHALEPQSSQQRSENAAIQAPVRFDPQCLMGSHFRGNTRTSMPQNFRVGPAVFDATDYMAHIVHQNLDAIGLGRPVPEFARPNPPRNFHAGGDNQQPHSSNTEPGPAYQYPSRQGPQVNVVPQQQPNESPSGRAYQFLPRQGPSGNVAPQQHPNENPNNLRANDQQLMISPLVNHQQANIAQNMTPEDFRRGIGPAWPPPRQFLTYIKTLIQTHKQYTRQEMARRLMPRIGIDASYFLIHRPSGRTTRRKPCPEICFNWDEVYSIIVGSNPRFMSSYGKMNLINSFVKSLVEEALYKRGVPQQVIVSSKNAPKLLLRKVFIGTESSANGPSASRNAEYSKRYRSVKSLAMQLRSCRLGPDSSQAVNVDRESSHQSGLRPLDKQTSKRLFGEPSTASENAESRNDDLDPDKSLRSLGLKPLDKETTERLFGTSSGAGNESESRDDGSDHNSEQSSHLLGLKPLDKETTERLFGTSSAGSESDAEESSSQMGLKPLDKETTDRLFGISSESRDGLEAGNDGLNTDADQSSNLLGLKPLDKETTEQLFGTSSDAGNESESRDDGLDHDSEQSSNLLGLKTLDKETAERLFGQSSDARDDSDTDAEKSSNLLGLKPLDKETTERLFGTSCGVANESESRDDGLDLDGEQGSHLLGLRPLDKETAERLFGTSSVGSDDDDEEISSRLGLKPLDKETTERLFGQSGSEDGLDAIGDDSDTGVEKNLIMLGLKPLDKETTERLFGEPSVLEGIRKRKSDSGNVDPEDEEEQVSNLYGLEPLDEESTEWLFGEPSLTVEIETSGDNPNAEDEESLDLLGRTPLDEETTDWLFDQDSIPEENEQMQESPSYVIDSSGEEGETITVSFNLRGIQESATVEHVQSSYRSTWITTSATVSTLDEWRRDSKKTLPNENVYHRQRRLQLLYPDDVTDGILSSSAKRMTWPKAYNDNSYKLSEEVRKLTAFKRVWQMYGDSAVVALNMERLICEPRFVIEQTELANCAVSENINMQSLLQALRFLDPTTPFFEYTLNRRQIMTNRMTNILSKIASRAPTHLNEGTLSNALAMAAFMRNCTSRYDIPKTDPIPYTRRRVKSDIIRLLRRSYTRLPLDDVKIAGKTALVKRVPFLKPRKCVIRSKRKRIWILNLKILGSIRQYDVTLTIRTQTRFRPHRCRIHHQVYHVYYDYARSHKLKLPGKSRGNVNDLCIQYRDMKTAPISHSKLCIKNRRNARSYKRGVPVSVNLCSCERNFRKRSDFDDWDFSGKHTVFRLFFKSLFAFRDRRHTSEFPIEAFVSATAYKLFSEAYALFFEPLDKTRVFFKPTPVTPDGIVLDEQEFVEQNEPISVQEMAYRIMMLNRIQNNVEEPQGDVLRTVNGIRHLEWSCLHDEQFPDETDHNVDGILIERLGEVHDSVKAKGTDVQDKPRPKYAKDIVNDSVDNGRCLMEDHMELMQREIERRADRLSKKSERKTRRDVAFLRRAFPNVIAQKKNVDDMDYWDSGALQIVDDVDDFDIIAGDVRGLYMPINEFIERVQKPIAVSRIDDEDGPIIRVVCRDWTTFDIYYIAPSGKGEAVNVRVRWYKCNMPAPQCIVDRYGMFEDIKVAEVNRQELDTVLGLSPEADSYIDDFLDTSEGEFDSEDVEFDAPLADLRSSDYSNSTYQAKADLDWVTTMMPEFAHLRHCEEDKIVNFWDLPTHRPVTAEDFPHAQVKEFPHPNVKDLPAEYLYSKLQPKCDILTEEELLQMDFLE